MQGTKDVQRARVVLRGSKTYNLGGKRWIKDVPIIINGKAVNTYKNNGHFHITMLKSKTVDVESKPKVKKSSTTDKKKKKSLNK